MSDTGGTAERITAPLISLLPLNADDHSAALQQVYYATPGYWAMYNLPGAPAQRAADDLREATGIPGRTMLGIVRHLPTDNNQGTGATGTTGVELVGLMDFRLHWPDPAVVYFGMVMVAEPYQRQGIGRAAWGLLAPWLAQNAQMTLARTGVEQFNPRALRFFQSIGFALTGDSNRIQSGRRWVRLLYMEQALTPDQMATGTQS